MLKSSEGVCIGEHDYREGMQWETCQKYDRKGRQVTRKILIL